MDPERDEAFRVCDARGAGVPRRAVDDRTLLRPFTGLRAVAAGDDEDAPESGSAQMRRAAHHFIAHMHEGEFFSHATAAALWALPLPPRDARRIDVSVLAPHRAPSGRGVRGHQLSPRQVSVVSHADGYRLSSPASTWAQLGGMVRHPYDLTAVADALLWTDRIAGPFGRMLRPPLSTVDGLRAELVRGRRIGIRALEEALERARAGVASRGETWTRLTIVDAGLPEPATDHDVYDRHGRFIGCVDLAYVERRIAMEYEGDHHRVDRRQWDRDIDRYDRLAEAGWRVIRVTGRSVFERPIELISRVGAALRSR